MKFLKSILLLIVLASLFSFGKKKVHWLIKDCESTYWEGSIMDKRIILQFIDEKPGDIWFTGQFKIFDSTSVQEYNFKGFTYSVVTPIFYGGQPNTKMCKILSTPNCDSLTIRNSRTDAFEYLPSHLVLYKKVK